MKKLLFVCLGNICRSPTAEAVMQALIKREGLEDRLFCDSAGTAAHHAGEPADPRMQNHARQRGYKLESIARQFQSRDFLEFDYILAMDESNLANIAKLDPEGQHHSKVLAMTSFCSQHQVPAVPDPYYGGDEGFRQVIDILEDACEGLLRKVRSEL